MVVRKEKFFPGCETPLVLQALLAEASKDFGEKNLKPTVFVTRIVVPSRLSDEAVTEICSHIAQVAQQFCTKHECAYAGGAIDQKTTLSEDELCTIVLEMAG